MRVRLKLLAGLAAIGWGGLAPASAADAWTYRENGNDGHILTYSDAGMTTFFLGCGRGFALHVKYPGTAKKAGKARITISIAKTRMAFDGEFEDPVPMNMATDFRQTYLGFRRQDPQLYGKRWMAIKSRLLDLIGSGEPLTISAGTSSYRLPPIDAANWRAPFDACGKAGSWN